MKLLKVGLLIAGIASILFAAGCGGGQGEPTPVADVKEVTPADAPAPTDTPEPTSILVPTAAPNPTSSSSSTPAPTNTPNPISSPSSTLPPIPSVLGKVSPELVACFQTALGSEQSIALISGQGDITPQQLGIVMPCLMQYPQDIEAIMDVFGLGMETIMGAGNPTSSTQPQPSTPVPTATQSPPTPTPTMTPGVPESSASAITSPPPDMEGINTHSKMYGTDADRNIITLGPKVGSHPDWEPYSNKTSMDFELNLSTPVLAPIDMVLVGFDNRNAKYSTYQDGQQDAPFNDLELCFESESPDWPGMIVCTYHLSTSPLLLGHNQNVSCGEVEEWQGTTQAVGHLFFEFDDYVSPGKGEFSSCDALIGRSVERGELIGFAGSVGTHSMAPFRFKVSHTSENPTVQKGNRYLHWVQPGSFFYWKCYRPDTIFPSGVLAYPFECGGYQLPAEQHDVNFKYSPVD